MSCKNKVVIVIPAYKPNFHLITFVANLKKQNLVIIIDDGSGNEYKEIFDELKKLNDVYVLTHAVNLGKGRSLKTAFNYVLLNFPYAIGVITADADGQHRISDIQLISSALHKNPNNLILGCRNFKKSNNTVEIPWKSRMGNALTRSLCSYLCGLDILDTQTGLRGIPISLLKKLMTTTGERYEYEMNYLLTCDVPIKQVPIETVYPENRTTHFNPLWDSLAIYKVLLAYLASSILVAGIDFVVFSILTVYGDSKIWFATALARASSAIFNFSLNRKVVFKATDGDSLDRQFFKYLALLIFSGTVSAVTISTLKDFLPVGVVSLKVAVELCLFFFNYYVQRAFVFAKSRTAHKLVDAVNTVTTVPATTNWTQYYSAGRSCFSTITQRFTLSRILNAIDKYLPPPPKNQANQGLQSIQAIRESHDFLSICELGGGNSCFVEQLCNSANVSRYDIIDNNRLAVEMFEKLPISVYHKGFCRDLLSNADEDFIFDGQQNQQAQKLQHPIKLTQPTQQYNFYDFVYSIGLIEHFRDKDIETLILRHFEFCKDDGIVLISFPTPTKKYRFIRRCMELLGCWQFYDEKPIKYSEVEECFKKYGTVLEHYTNYKLPLTQEIVIAKKKKNII